MPTPSWISFLLARGISSPSSSFTRGGLLRAISKVTHYPKLGPVRDTNTISLLNPGNDAERQSSGGAYPESNGQTGSKGLLPVIVSLPSNLAHTLRNTAGRTRSRL